MGILKPKLNDVEGDSWEELDTMEIGNGAQSLRWLVWVRTCFFLFVFSSFVSIDLSWLSSSLMFFVTNRVTSFLAAKDR